MKKKNMTLAEHLANGNGSWFFFAWSMIFVLDAFYKWYRGWNFMGEFWFGCFMLLVAILFCPCYAGKTCHVLGIHRYKK